MSDYHIKEITKDGRKANVIFHIPIPVEDNIAGVALRTAVSQYIGNADFVSQIPWITTELTQLQNGELYEKQEIITFPAGDTNGEKQTQIDSRYSILALDILDTIRERLKFWGKDRNVV